MLFAQNIIGNCLTLRVKEVSMKSTIKNLLMAGGAMLFLLSPIAEGLSAPPKHPPPKHPLGKPHVHRVPPKHAPPVYKTRKYIAAPPAFRPNPPGPKYLWVPRYRHPSGVYIGGYWRPPSKPGFTWVDGYSNTAGVRIFGYWKPIRVKPGYIWAPGYWNNTVWVNGYWRQAQKPNLVWVPGHYNSNGVRKKGHWK